MNFWSKAVVIANGAIQGLPESSKFIGSDKFLQRDTFCKVNYSLKPGATVVIIGGSHSGFSCAWLLLNGP